MYFLKLLDYSISIKYAVTAALWHVQLEYSLSLQLVGLAFHEVISLLKSICNCPLTNNIAVKQF
jgi:hypothetical protein